jgi:hypothetical protein
MLNKIKDLMISEVNERRDMGENFEIVIVHFDIKEQVE